MEFGQETHSPSPICSSAQGACSFQHDLSMSLCCNSPPAHAPEKPLLLLISQHRPPPSPQMLALPSVWSAVPTYGRAIRAPHVSSLTSQTLGVCGPVVRGPSSLVDPKLTEEPSWCRCPSPHYGDGSLAPGPATSVSDVGGRTARDWEAGSYFHPVPMA